MSKVFDLCIIGSGPAALTCAIYSSRSGRDILMLEGPIPGGAIVNKSVDIENYPGIITNGFDLMNKFNDHVKFFNSTTSIRTSATKIDTSNKPFIIYDNENNKYQAHSIVIASGSKAKMLNIPGEQEYYGSGVSVCAVCDGFFFKGKNVCIVGGASLAIESALYLSNIARNVYIIYRGNKLKGEVVMREKLATVKNIKVMYNLNVLEIRGDSKKVTGILMDNNQEMPIDAVFLAIGTNPVTHFAQDSGIEIDDYGYIKTYEYVKTNISGIYAAGDVARNKFAQVIVAASDGCIASLTSDEYLNSIK